MWRPSPLRRRAGPFRPRRRCVTAMQRATAAALTVCLVASCAARGSVVEIAYGRAAALGLGETDRRRFAGEVDACVTRAEGARPVGPAGTLAVGVSGEAEGGSPAGLAGIGVIAGVLAAGVAYRWWRAIGHRGGRAAEPGAAMPATSTASAGAAATKAPAAQGGNAAVPAAGTSTAGERRSGDSALDACIDDVTARWRSRAAEGAPAP